MSGFTPDGFDVVHSAPVWMSMHERVLLYGVVAGLQPERTLEIGTFKGGSTLIMCAALDDLGKGRIVCVDPEPRVDPEHWARVEHRATMVAAPSPEALRQAAEIAGGGFDFALIDGDHSHLGVIRDIEATLPTLADDAHLLFHDAHYFQVRDAIDEELRKHAGQLVDAGMMSVDFSPDAPDAEGNEVKWGGLRMLRFRRHGVPAAAAPAPEAPPAPPLAPPQADGDGLARSAAVKPVRDAVGRRLHALIDRRVEERLARARAEIVAEAAERARHAALREPQQFGPPDRLHVAPTARVNDALFNTVSGSITVGDHAFFGHGVAVLTGTHDVSVTGAARSQAIPPDGRDVEIGPGAWVASRAVVLGPCRIGADAVVSAGAVVTGEVPAGAVVAGVPARVVRELDRSGAVT